MVECTVLELDSQNTDALNCGCSSQWLLDNQTSNSTCWYTNGHSEFCTDISQINTQNESDLGTSTDKQISTENTINDASGWTKKEKNLLERGIEIFGKSNTRLAQFIGTKSSLEVKYYLKHFYNGPTVTQCITEEGVIDDNIIEETVTTENIELASDGPEVLDESEIPASIEEIIAVVSTAKPTVQINSKKPRKNSDSKAVDNEMHFLDIPSGHSLLKTNVYKYVDYKTKYRGRKNSELETPIKKIRKHNPGEVKFKFSTGMKVKAKLKPTPQINEIKEQPIAQNIPNLNGEEVIKISKNDKEDLESDIEIDVENDDIIKEELKSPIENIIIKSEEGKEELSETTEEEFPQETVKKIEKDLLDLTEEVNKQLMSLEIPICELILSQDVVTDLEKCFNGEFFEGRSTKTPDRYLRIRNHILNMWIVSKPTYVTKTSIRPGLKNCGDVNCIGRIHQFLEQVGAINFGCAQTNYLRPLYNVLVSNITISKDKITKDASFLNLKPLALQRPRIKKKFTNNGEGGCTLAHNENGEVINTTVVNEEPVIKQRPYIKKPTIRLIYCKPFNEENPQRYSVHLHLSSLLLMDLHSHMSHTEVMGLIGGYWDPKKETLTILRYVSCRNSAPSATHCDMCPISQAKAADTIHNEGLNILGWFHSHPTFAPEPSQQDLDTQLTVQQWIGITKPCIGLILSPFSAHGALIASPYRCLIVSRKHNFEDQYVPYKFKVELISSNLDVNFLLGQAWKIFNTDSNVASVNRVDFGKPYFLDQSITYYDKFISSIKMHLAKCADINKMTCDAITDGFANICCNQV